MTKNDLLKIHTYLTEYRHDQAEYVKILKYADIDIPLQHLCGENEDAKEVRARILAETQEKVADIDRLLQLIGEITEYADIEELPKEKQTLYVLGGMFYNEYTDKRQKPITPEQAEQINDEVIDAIFYYFTMTDEVDFELDQTAFLSWEALAKAKCSRRSPTPEAEIRAKWEQFKQDHKQYFTE